MTFILTMCNAQYMLLLSLWHEYCTSWIFLAPCMLLYLHTQHFELLSLSSLTFCPSSSPVWSFVPPPLLHQQGMHTWILRLCSEYFTIPWTWISWLPCLTSGDLRCDHSGTIYCDELCNTPWHLFQKVANCRLGKKRLANSSLRLWHSWLIVLAVWIFIGNFYATHCACTHGGAQICMFAWKLNTSKMFRIPKPQTNVPVNNCHLMVTHTIIF